MVRVKHLMPSDIFSKNIAALERHFPLLAEELDKEDSIAPDELVVEGASVGDQGEGSGVPTLIIKGIYVHSKRDPEREAQRLVESTAAASVGGGAPALILGFGLGYAAIAFAAKFPGRPIIIVEKHPAVLKKALEVRDFTSFLSENKLVFVLGGTGEGVTSALSLFESSADAPPVIIQNRALTGLDEEWYAAVEGQINSWNSRTNVNRATQKRFGKRWVRNLSINLEAIRDIPGISCLEGILEKSGIPVFLAAAGPTLDTAAPLLGEISKRCVIVAVDTSLRFLLSRGIDPDFLVSVDPQYWNFRHLDRVPAPKTRLVAESAVYPSALRHPFEGIFLCASFFPLGSFIEAKVDPKGALGAGGSVATSAWDFARLLGARQIWIAGLDLSFPELKTHFKGAVFEEKAHAGSGRFSPVETWNFHALRDGQPFQAKQQGGGTVLTDKRLSLYAAWFENRFSRFPDVKNIALSADGLAIPGLETAPAADLLAMSERRDEINSLLSGVYAGIEQDFGSPGAKKNRENLYKNAKENLVFGLAEIKNLAHDAAQSAEAAAKCSRQGRLNEKDQDKVLKKLDAANKSISESAVKEISGFLFPETGEWETEIAGKTQNPLTRHLEFSARFYRSLAEAAEYNLLKLKN